MNILHKHSKVMYNILTFAVRYCGPVWSGGRPLTLLTEHIRNTGAIRKLVLFKTCNCTAPVSM